MSRGPGLPPVQAALFRAFHPGGGASLRSISAKPCHGAKLDGEWVVIEFDLPDAASRKRAFEIARGCSGSEVPLPGAILSGGTAAVKDDVLTVECLVVSDEPSGARVQSERHSEGGPADD